jgi:hypothetical protein
MPKHPRVVPRRGSRRGLNLGELIHFLHERALGGGLSEREASRLTAIVVARTLQAIGHRRLLGALGATPSLGSA